MAAMSDLFQQKMAKDAAYTAEDIEVLEIAFDDVLAMIDDGRIEDAKTIMLLQYAALHGLLDA